jgi:hypothetical protein
MYPSVFSILVYFFDIVSSILAGKQRSIMRFSTPALLVYLTAAEAAAAPSIQSSRHVRQYNLPCRANNSLTPIFGSNGTVTIKGTTTTPGIVVLDYGTNVEGHPTFEILSATGDTSRLEITYSESKRVLDSFYMVRIPLQALEIYTNPYYRATDQLL